MDIDEIKHRLFYIQEKIALSHLLCVPHLVKLLHFAKHPAILACSNGNSNNHINFILFEIEKIISSTLYEIFTDIDVMIQRIIFLALHINWKLQAKYFQFSYYVKE